jgi:hypothetical protein
MPDGSGDAGLNCQVGIDRIQVASSTGAAVAKAPPDPEIRGVRMWRDVPLPSAMEPWVDEP